MERAMTWWPVLLWIIVPTVHWCFHNNMEENTMGIFTTAAVLWVVRAHGAGGWWRYALAGVLIFLASFAKGLPGLFPLGAPVLMRCAMAGPTWGRAFGASVLMTVVVVVGYGLLLLHPDAQGSFMKYIEGRLLHRIAENPTVDSRFATLEMLFTNMLGPLIIAGVLAFAMRRTVAPWREGLQRPALAMLLVGLSGTAPLMLTMVQKSFYMAAALPIVALAIALWSAPALAGLLARMRPEGPGPRIVRGIGAAAIIGAFVAGVFLFGTPGRDKELLEDVHAIGGVVPPRSLVGVPPDMWNEWSLQTYLMRYHFVSMSDRPVPHAWYLTLKEGGPPGSDFVPVDVPLHGFRLWRAAGAADPLR